MALVATYSTLNIGLIDEKYCPNKALEYAASLGVSNVKAIIGITLIFSVAACTNDGNSNGTTDTTVNLFSLFS